MTAPARTDASVPIRSRRVPRVLVTAVAVAAATASFAAVSVPAQAAAGTGFVKAVRVCADGRAQHASCFAMKVVPAHRGETGARPATTHVQSKAVSLYGPAGGYTPAALAGAYGVNRTLATTQVVGIVDAYADPNVKPDLNAFDAQYGFPAETATSFRVVNQRGATSPLPTANAGWAGEISLDVDSVRGMCAKCKIILVEADSNSFADLGAAENKAVALGATVVSNSFGGAESGGAPSAAYLAAFKHPGVVITASTGDDGWYDWDHLNAGSASSNSPQTPSSFTSVVAVGGTTLNLDNTGARANESVWNNNGPDDVIGNYSNLSLGASGGGCSTLYAAPTWQRAVAGYAATGCGTKRLAGDISALADPFTGYDIYDTYQAPGWQTFGGTSLASPLVAAMFALAGGAGGVDYPTKTLYANSTAGVPVYDVRVGGNSACGGGSTTSCAGFFGGSPNVTGGAGRIDCSWAAAPSTALVAANGQCNAKVGYDGPSGVGSPSGLGIFTP